MKDFEITITAVNPEVTGSGFSIIIERPKIKTENILIDCGKNIKAEYQHLNNCLQVDTTKIDSVLVTHSHQDHTGKLTYLTRAGYRGNIYCSKISQESIPISLNDGYNIDFKEAKFKNKQMYYSLADVSEVKNLLKGMEYNVPFKISKYTTVTFFMNSHMLGAASILLQIECPRHPTQYYLFFGDYSRNNLLFKALPIPNNVKKLPLHLVLEATYGNAVSTRNQNLFFEHLKSELEKGNNILLPTIVQERLEVILYKLRQAQEQNILDKKVAIFVHSKLGKEFFNSIYCKYTDIKKFLPSNLMFVPDYDFQKAILHKGQKIILAGSGMADDGTIRFYLEQYLESSNTSIIFTCYTPAYTTGGILKNAKIGQPISINGNAYKLNCPVLTTSEFSQHIRGDEWPEVLEEFTKIQSISINHGEREAKKHLKERLREIYNDIPITILDDKCGILVNEFGISTFEPVFETYSFDVNYSSDYSQKKNKRHKVAQTKKRRTSIIAH